MSKKAKSPIEEETKKLQERVGKRIIEALKALDEPFAVEGMHTRPVMKKADGYRQKPLAPNSEHFLADFRVGAKGQLIFKAIPVETSEYEWADVDEHAMDEVFPLVGASLAEALDIKECEDFRAVIKEMTARVIQEDQEAEAAAIEAKKAADQAYVNNPLFGRF